MDPVQKQEIILYSVIVATLQKLELGAGISCSWWKNEHHTLHLFNMQTWQKCIGLLICGLFQHLTGRASGPYIQPPPHLNQHFDNHLAMQKETKLIQMDARTYEV